MVRTSMALLAFTAFLASSGARLDACPITSVGLTASAQDGWLGVMLVRGSERPTVLEVIPDSPAAKAGLRPGDVFLAVGEAAIESLSDLQRELGAKAAGSGVELSMNRGGDRLIVNVLLGQSPEAPMVAQSQSAVRDSYPAKPSGESSGPSQDTQGKAFLGVSVREEGNGVRIETVVEGSPAAKAGLREGDLMQSIDGKAIENIQDLQRAMSRLRPGQQVRIQIERGDTSRNLRVTMGGAVAKPEPAKPEPAKPEPTKRSEKSATGARETARARLDQDQERGRIEADLKQARDQMDKERAALEAELKQARAETERSLQQAMREVERARARIEEEMNQARVELEDERRRTQSEMAKARAQLQRELNRARQEAEKEMQRMNREMAREQSKSQKEMGRQRERFDKELTRSREEMEAAQTEAAKEMARQRQRFDKELTLSREEMEAAQTEVEKEMALQRRRFEKELILSREEMDRTRRRMSPQSRSPATPTSRPSHGPVPGSGQNPAGLQSEFERIRAELRELKALLKRKRH